MGAEQALAALVQRNNETIERADPLDRNPIDLRPYAWNDALASRHGTIRAEWDAFVAEGGRLPLIADVLGEHQGNEGPWRAGVLTDGTTVSRLGRTRFPATMAALDGVPGLRAALWSVLEPGTELTEHNGPNRGVLRYHLGIDCRGGSELRVGSTVTPYEDGVGILFDDTAPHAAWNHGDAPRVTLFCEIERPLPVAARMLNRLTQAVIGRDPRRRRIVGVADEWDEALNPRSSRPTADR